MPALIDPREMKQTLARCDDILPLRQTQLSIRYPGDDHWTDIVQTRTDCKMESTDEDLIAAIAMAYAEGGGYGEFMVNGTVTHKVWTAILMIMDMM